MSDVKGGLGERKNREKSKKKCAVNFKGAKKTERKV